MNIAIYGMAYREEHFPFYNQLFTEMTLQDCGLWIHKELWKQIAAKFSFVPVTGLFKDEEDISGKVDSIFSVGGDGTFLHAIRFAARSGLPILGFNTGRMGFLSSISLEEISCAIKAVISADYDIEVRSLLELQTRELLFKGNNYALNEICIHKKDSSSMISIHAYVNNQFLNTYWADGLIISTPTGSTAYSLSCGGPILTPDSQNFIIIPVASHNLTVRPIVIPDTCSIRLKTEGREDSFLLSLDSRSETIPADLELNICKSDHCVNMIKLRPKHFFNTIREKLMWGMDKRN
jgi:NAD+ kinase